MQIEGSLLDVGSAETVQFSGPATATAVAITAGTVLEYVTASDVVQAATDSTAAVFFGIAKKDYAASATDVVGYYGVVKEIASAATHDIGVPAYAAAGGAGVTAASSVGPRVGTFVGARSSGGLSKVVFEIGGGPALS